MNNHNETKTIKALPPIEEVVNYITEYGFNRARKHFDVGYLKLRLLLLNNNIDYTTIKKNRGYFKSTTKLIKLKEKYTLQDLIDLRSTMKAKDLFALLDISNVSYYRLLKSYK